MSSRRLQPIPVPTGGGVLDLLPALRAALSGAGPALLPYAEGTVPAAVFAPGEPLAAGEDDPDDPTVAVVTTSGSTGRPKGALLSASALLASTSATHDRLGGPGRWLLALPAEHVAGLQVLLRSLVARTVPTVLDLAGGFDPAAFVRAAAATTGGRRYTSLVPTQVRRLLAAGPAAREALAGFDAVLVGGAACPPGLLAEAGAAGARLVVTYGMSETCGGCVYDGLPLDGVRVALDADGRVRLGGPVLARGYRGGISGVDSGVDVDASRAGSGAGSGEGSGAGSGAGSGEGSGADQGSAFGTDADGTRWFRTEDTARWEAGPPARLTVLDRLDDLIVTGGLKVSPALVEAALLGLPGVAEVIVVGAPDPDWGQRVVAALVLTQGASAPTLDAVRRRVTARTASHAAPRQLLVLESLPLRGPGKPDRARLIELAQR